MGPPHRGRAGLPSGAGPEQTHREARGEDPRAKKSPRILQARRAEGWKQLLATPPSESVRSRRGADLNPADRVVEPSSVPARPTDIPTLDVSCPVCFVPGDLMYK